MRIVDADQRETAAERARMPRSGEGHQRSAQAVALPVGLALVPVARMSSKSKQDLVSTPILIELIGEVAAGTGLGRTGRANQRQADGLVVALVGSVLDVGQNGRAVGSVPIGQIDPVMRGDLELAVKSGWPLDCTDLPVVCGHGIGGRKWKNGLEICGKGSPVDYV